MGGDVKDLKGLSSKFSLGFCKFSENIFIE
jgi:hypothetical protein